MILRYFYLILFNCCFTLSYAQDSISLNVELFGQFHRGDQRYSGSWAYIDNAGNEYALLGTRTGTAAYTIDDAMQIDEVGFIAGPESNWREITVIGTHAFVTTEGASDTTGMQVIDLQYLPDSIHLLTTYSETFTRGHILQRNMYSDSAFVYISGTTSTQGVHILDVSNPADPVEIGLYEPGYYIHDCHVKNDLLFACAFYEGVIDIVDISDKSNPVLIAQVEDPTGSTHSCWMTEDNRFLILCSEMDGLPSRVFNIEDIGNIYEVTQYTANQLSLVHNPYIRGDFCFYSHNTEGLRVVDVVDPELPIEVGFYDTFDGPSGGFSGLWSAWPFYPSGKIIGGNREDGLYVWTFNNTYGGRIYGIVKDSISGEIINDAEIILLENQDTLLQNFNAEFKFGEMAGTYNLSVKKDGYISKIETIELNEGDSNAIVVELVADDWVSTAEPRLPKGKMKIAPNPFSVETKISLQDTNNGYTLKLFDSKGQSMTGCTTTEVQSTA